MSYRKKTLRQLQPMTRRYARLVNQAESLTRKLKNMTEEIDRLESDSRALATWNEQRRKEHYRKEVQRNAE